MTDEDFRLWAKGRYRILFNHVTGFYSLKKKYPWYERLPSTYLGESRNMQELIDLAKKDMLGIEKVWP